MILCVLGQQVLALKAHTRLEISGSDFCFAYFGNRTVDLEEVDIQPAVYQQRHDHGEDSKERIKDEAGLLLFTLLAGNMFFMDDGLFARILGHSHAP